MVRVAVLRLCASFGLEIRGKVGVFMAILIDCFP